LLLSQLALFWNFAVLPNAMAGGAPQAGPNQIQWICNGKLTPITMQALARAGETPPAQEQWKTMEKTMRRTMETMRIGARHLAEVVTAGTRGLIQRRQGIIDIAGISPLASFGPFCQLGLRSHSFAQARTRPVLMDILARRIVVGKNE
jgi:hypothetical protein